MRSPLIKVDSKVMCTTSGLWRANKIFKDGLQLKLSLSAIQTFCLSDSVYNLHLNQLISVKNDFQVQYSHMTSLFLLFRPNRIESAYDCH